MKKLTGLIAACFVLVVAALPLGGNAAAHDGSRGHGKPLTLPGGFKHLVVIYQENHSFDNLYGDWGPVNGEQVEGLDQATPANSTQVAQDGTPYTCLLQNDVNLTSPPLPGDCQDPHTVNTTNDVKNPATRAGFTSHFANGPFSIDDFIHPQDTTCPKPGTSAPNGVPNGTGDPGGCTRDLVHRFYQEQYQINGGAQNRYVTGSDAVGLAMGTYDTKALPVYKYLHSKGAPKYVLADRFFQAAFGGSFLNHQWLIAARSPLDTDPSFNPAVKAANSVLDDNGMVAKYPLYTPTRNDVVDGPLTAKCDDGRLDDVERACGDFAVNTIQPASQPRNNAGARLPLIDDQRFPNIGDRMSDADISWNWYSGGWDRALEDAQHVSDPQYQKKAPLFQFHHQPFNYFADYAPGQPGRAHLQDETDFFEDVAAGELPTVSFVKPYGAENEHPGYASEPDGSDHLVDLLKAVEDGPQAGNTLVVVTYDEFGGQWDHVSPPVVDAWGPGTRIPALVIGRRLKHSGVDHTTYDTTSILATIERSFGLEPLTSRDAAVNDLSTAVAAGGR